MKKTILLLVMCAILVLATCSIIPTQSTTYNDDVIVIAEVQEASTNEIDDIILDEIYEDNSIITPDLTTEVVDDEIIGSITNTENPDFVSITFNGVQINLESNGSGYTITGYSGTPTTLTLSTSEYTITKIANGAFKGCKTLTSVDLSLLTSLVTIGDKAFYGCTSLSTVVIPGSVTSIGDYVFYATPWLASQRANSNQRLVIVNNILLDGRTATGAITIPSTVTKISNLAFAYNTKITSITMTSITTVPYEAFFSCKNLQTASLANVVTIGERAFYGCESLTAVTNINSTLKTVKDFAFAQCFALNTFDVATSGIFTTIEYGAFQYCKSLTSFNFNLYIAKIGIAAFYKCTGLTTITFDASTTSLTKLYDGAFYGCTKLATINNLPAGVTQGIGVFTGTVYGA